MSLFNSIVSKTLKMLILSAILKKNIKNKAFNFLYPLYGLNKLFKENVVSKSNQRTNNYN